MYYENKSKFYMKQYGPSIIITAISFLFIASGVLLYFKTSGMGVNTAEIEDTQEIAQQVEPQIEEEILESNSIVEETPTETKEEKPQGYFSTIAELEKSKEVNVTDISDNGEITISIDGDSIKLNLIGIDYSYVNKAQTIEKMKKDLLSKNIKVAFDKVREDKHGTYAYVYLGNKLYNQQLLNDGLATLKSERSNITLQKELAQAQADARTYKTGVWNK